MRKSEDLAGDKSGSRRAKGKATRKLVGVRIEPRLVKVIKAVSELHDCALGELLEQVFWHSMEGGNFFAEGNKIPAKTREQLDNLKSVYGVDYDLDYLRNKTSEDEED